MTSYTSSLVLGHSVGYWLDLEKRLEGPEYDTSKSNLLEEIITLRGRISFYESKIRDMHELMEKKL